MANFRSDFQRNLFPGIELKIKSAFDEIPTEYSQMFNVKTSDSAFEEFLGAAGVGLFVKTKEREETPEDKFYKGFPKRYNHDEYMLKIGCTWLAMKDGKVKIFGERASDLGYSMRQTKEIIHADILNSGFTVNGFDGVPLFSTAHPFYRGGTQSNILTPVGTLSLLNYRLALTQFRRMKDHTGVRRIRVMPVKLTVPPELEHVALEIVTSPDRPDTANRAKNVVMNKTSVFVYNYLMNIKNWFIFPDKSRIKIRVFEREAFRVDEYEDKDARLNWVRGMFRTSSGHDDYLGPIGVNPA